MKSTISLTKPRCFKLRMSNKQDAKSKKWHKVLSIRKLLWQNPFTYINIHLNFFSIWNLFFLLLQCNGQMWCLSVHAVDCRAVKFHTHNFLVSAVYINRTRRKYTRNARFNKCWRNKTHRLLACIHLIKSCINCRQIFTSRLLFSLYFFLKKKTVFVCVSQNITKWRSPVQIFTDELV